METKKIRIGFVGAGHMGQCAHLRNYVTLPDCAVAALAELRRETGKRVGERYGIPRVYENYQEMLVKESLDGLVASQPFTRHGQLIPDLLKAGIPVLTEKPLAGTIQTGEMMVDAVRRSGTFLMIGYHKRSDPATQYAKQEIEKLKASRELGRMKYVRILIPAGNWSINGFLELIDAGDPAPELTWDPPPPDMDEKSFKEYSAFVNYYIHQVNYMRYMLGESYRVTYTDPSGVILAGTSKSGIACMIEMSPYTTTLDWQESILVAFEHGYVKIELPAPMVINRPGRVEIFKDPGKGVTPQTVITQLPWIHAMRQQAMNFVAAIRGESKPPCEAPEALEDLKVAREYVRLKHGV